MFFLCNYRLYINDLNNLNCMMFNIYYYIFYDNCYVIIKSFVINDLFFFKEY